MPAAANCTTVCVSTPTPEISEMAAELLLAVELVVHGTGGSVLVLAHAKCRNDEDPFTGVDCFSSFLQQWLGSCGLWPVRTAAIYFAGSRQSF